MSDSRFNRVAFLDAIPDGELKTARRLREDLEDMASSAAPGLEVRYFRILTVSSLESAISALQQEARLHGLIPWLHLDGHGWQDESGFATADGSFCSWSHLVELITPLNITTNLNVIIVLATCYGGSFTRAITTIDRAPVLGLIGPTREIVVGAVETDFPAFYKSFFTTGSLKLAISALTARAHEQLYYWTTGQEFFYAVWAGYKREFCSDGQMVVRARRIRKKLKSVGANRISGLGELKRKFRSKEKGVFEKYRDKYFMYDLYPDNRTRFPVTYKQAEKEFALTTQSRPTR